MKKFIITFIFLFISMFCVTTVNAKELTITSNFDYSIEMFNTTYYISYDLDGGTLDRINTYTPEAEDFELGIPVKEGYVFLGWTGSNGHIPDPKTIVKQGTVMNLTFKANWKKLDYGINYNMNGSNSTIAPSYYDKETGEIILGEPYRYGYTFDGWTGSNGNTVSKNVKINGGTKNLSYKANWTAIDYSIIYIPNDNNLSYANMPNNPTNYTVETDTITLVNPTRTAYNFLGWIGSNGKTNSLTVKIPKGSIGERVFKAMWEAIVYDITFDLNGGTGVSDRTYTIETPDFTLNKPNRRGYTFLGYTESNGTTAQTDVTIKQGSWGDKSYKANWQANKYTVTLNKNGGSGGQNSVEATFDSDIPNVTTPTRTGYNFLGYYDSVDGGTKYINVNGTSAKIWDKDEDTTLYAHWEKATFTVTYKKDGNPWQTREIKYGDPIENLIPDGYDTYHKFGGWSGWPSDGKMPAGDLELNAITSETYCYLTTGTAGYDNAVGLRDVFISVGFTAEIYGNNLGYGASTGYNLTRSQVDNLKGTFGNLPAWSSGGSPWINWLSIGCDNGHGETWKRYSNGNTWQIETQW